MYIRLSSAEQTPVRTRMSNQPIMDYSDAKGLFARRALAIEILGKIRRSLNSEHTEVNFQSAMLSTMLGNEKTRQLVSEYISSLRMPLSEGKTIHVQASVTEQLEAIISDYVEFCASGKKPESPAAYANFSSAASIATSRGDLKLIERMAEKALGIYRNTEDGNIRVKLMECLVCLGNNLSSFLPVLDSKQIEKYGGIYGRELLSTEMKRLLSNNVILNEKSGDVVEKFFHFSPSGMHCLEIAFLFSNYSGDRELARAYLTKYVDSMPPPVVELLKYLALSLSNLSQHMASRLTDAYGSELEFAKLKLAIALDKKGSEPAVKFNGLDKAKDLEKQIKEFEKKAKEEKESTKENEKYIEFSENLVSDLEQGRLLKTSPIFEPEYYKMAGIMAAEAGMENLALQIADDLLRNYVKERKYYPYVVGYHTLADVSKIYSRLGRKEKIWELFEQFESVLKRKKFLETRLAMELEFGDLQMAKETFDKIGKNQNSSTAKKSVGKDLAASKNAHLIPNFAICLASACNKIIDVETKPAASMDTIMVENLLSEAISAKDAGFVKSILDCQAEKTKKRLRKKYEEQILGLKV